ncbi:MAG TPA: hypothetical protein VNU66_13960, partial [Mycobacteriales bacterium]|nr:hypothetical protein [Mycobacteriales bacterium]
MLCGLALAVLAAPASAADGPVFTSTTAVQSSTTVNWAGTVPATATVTCTVTAPSGATTTPDCATPDGGFAVTVTGAADGEWTLLVTSTVTDELGGTTTASDSRTTRVDTVAPEVSVTTPASPSTVRTPSWSVTVVDGTATCEVTGPGVAVRGPCGPSFTTTLPSSPGGEYVLVATAVDAAGNTASATATPYVLLVPPPPADVVAEPSPSSSPEATWTFSTHGATATCRLTGPGTDETTTGCASPFTRTLGPDGGYVLEVVLTGDGGSSTSSASYELDTTAPATPGVDGPSGRTASTTLTWSFPLEHRAECTLVRNSTAQPVTPCSGSVTATDLQDGTYVLEVVLVDAAGNRSGTGRSASTTVDTTAPAEPQVLSGPSGLTNGGTGRSFTWNLSTATAPDVTECRLLGGGLPDTWAQCDGSWTVSTVDLPDGPYVLEVRTRDDLGNTSASTLVSLELDTVAPVLSSVTAPPSPSRTAVIVVNWDGDADGTPTCTAALDGAVRWTVVGCDPSWIVDLTGEPDGTWTFTVSLLDAAGNRSAELSALYELDRQPPAPVIFTTTPRATDQRMPTWTFSAEGAVAYTCRLTGPGDVE